MIDLLEYLRKYIVFDTLTLENDINKTRNYSKGFALPTSVVLA